MFAGGRDAIRPSFQGHVVQPLKDFEIISVNGPAEDDDDVLLSGAYQLFVKGPLLLGAINGFTGPDPRSHFRVLSANCYYDDFELNALGPRLQATAEFYPDCDRWLEETVSVNSTLRKQQTRLRRFPLLVSPVMAYFLRIGEYSPLPSLATRPGQDTQYLGLALRWSSEPAARARGAFERIGLFTCGSRFFEHAQLSVVELV